MAMSAHSLTMSQNLPSLCLTKCNKILTFTCSISKLYGVLLVTKIICEINVFMRITGKTSEDSLFNLSINPCSVYHGRLKRISKPTRTDVAWNTDVGLAMAGKNLSTILPTTRSTNVKYRTAANVKSPTVLTTTTRVRRELFNKTNFSGFIPKTVALVWANPSNTKSHQSKLC